MKNLTSIILLIIIAAFTFKGKNTDIHIIATKGKFPILTTDKFGKTHLVYGDGENIYYAELLSNSLEQSKSVLVDKLTGLALGAKRSPQIACSDDYIVITATTKEGNVFSYNMNRKSGEWSKKIQVNDVADVAKEGFTAVSGTETSTFYAVWLDLREDHKNKIYGTKSTDGGKSWSKNYLVYRSPDSTVCECCKPSIVADKNQVYVMFRNWLNGSRDMYVAHSIDGAISFPDVQKMGKGTWKLNACPMDGGGIAMNKKGKLITVWRRENAIYTNEIGKEEQEIAKGVNCSIAITSNGSFFVYENDGKVFLKKPNGNILEIGNGKYPKIASMGADIFCCWQNDGAILGEIINGTK